MEQMKSRDLSRANQIVRDLTRHIDEAFPEMQKVLDKTLSPKEKKKFYKDLNKLLFDGDISKGILDPQKADAAIKAMRALGVSGETSG